MKTMRMKQFIYLAAALLALGSCSEDQSGNSLPTSGERVTVSLSLQPSDMQQVNLSGSSSSALKITRSVTALADADEKVINNLWVFEYVDGTYVRGQYLSTVDATKLNLDLSKATSANIYFVANVGEAAYKGKTLATEADFKSYSLSITDEASITPSAGYLPMFGQVSGVSIPDYFKSGATVKLDYMVSRVDFTYTVTGNMSTGFALKQSRLIGVPGKMYPYINPENMDTDPGNDTNFPADGLSTLMFDRENIDVANSMTGTLTFYLPDNRRGVGSNTDATDAKLKGGINNATAIQLIGYKDGDEITYNFYLGGDEFNDYNLKRNTKYTLAADLDGTSTGDLRVTQSQTANTYMVNPGGTVLIPVKRANQSDLGEQLADVNMGWSPGVLWRDNSSLDIDVTNLGNGVMQVIASNTTAKGNAVVYIKDGSNNILWSWHIWVTDYNPVTDYESYNGYTFMNRNLGAMSNTKGNLSSLGLVYQWGRKDPFAGANKTSGITNGSTSDYAVLYSGASGTTTYTSVNNAAPTNSPNNLLNAVRNPGVFYFKATSPNDWYIGSISNLNGVLWGITKTVYDPCPAGWKIAPGAAFNSWADTSEYGWDGTNLGRIAANNSTYWYPASGYRTADSGALNNIGGDGWWWNATGGAMSFYSGGVFANNGTGRASGCSVRCVQEK